MKRHTYYKRLAVLLFLAGVSLLAWLAGRGIEKPALVNTEGRTFQRAQVVQVVQDNLLPDGSRMGNQVVLIELKSGPLKGQVAQATSADGLLFGAVCRPGMGVVVISSIAGERAVHSVYSVDRIPALLFFVLLFFAALCLVGGKSGLKSAAALAFTMLCLFVIYLPLIYKGYSPFLCAVLVCAVTTCATMYLVGGCCAKTLAATAGTVAGVLAAGLSAALFGRLAGIGGYNVSNIESLVFVGQTSRVQVGGLLFSGILIASLGAVMDVAMSIASAVSEIHSQNPALPRRALFSSGMNVGRDMMGTMSNTLILAFVGGALGNLVLNYAYDLPALQVLNSSAVGIEIMQGVSGSLGIILTVPLVSLLCAWWLPAGAQKPGAPHYPPM